MNVKLNQNDIAIISEALTEYWQQTMKYSKNSERKKEVSNLKIDFKQLKNLQNH